MAFEWMTDDAFREEIEIATGTAAGRGGMDHYEPAIVDRIVMLIRENAQQRRLEEERKYSAQQRGKVDALSSIRLLIETAASIAKRDGRKELTVADLEAAYQTKLCQIWPLC